MDLIKSIIGILCVLIIWFTPLYLALGQYSLRANGIETTGKCVGFEAREECTSTGDDSEICYDVDYPVVEFMVEGELFVKTMNCLAKEGGTWKISETFSKNETVPILYLKENPRSSAQVNTEYCIEVVANVYYYWFIFLTLVFGGFFIYIHFFAN